MARQPAVQTPRGIIRCADCRTDEYARPTGPRIDERHVGRRLGDGSTGSHRWHVYLNGQNVTERCDEAYAGDDGWVILYDEDTKDHRYVCAFSRRGGDPHACAIKIWGRVDVVRTPVG